MAITFTPILIAAVGTAGVALVLTVAVVTYFTCRRLTRNAAPSRPSRSARQQLKGPPTFDHRENRASLTTWGFVLAPTTIAPEEGIGSASSGNTTLVTPQTSKLKKSGGLFGKKSVSKDKVESTQPSPINLRPKSSESMVVVTYEEGLAKLGVSRPHHILYPSEEDEPEPPNLELARQAYSAASPRLVPGRSGLRRAGSGSEGERPAERQGSEEDSTPSTVSTYIIGTPSEGRIVDFSGQSGKAQSTWLPSYYHSPQSRGYQADGDDGASELNYAMSMPRGYGNRI